MVIYTIIGFVALAALWCLYTFNKLVSLRNQVKNAWSQIDVQLQRRYDLIPNLVEAVKGYMTYEKETLEAVIKARNQASTARQSLQKEGGPTKGSMQGLLSAENSLRGAMGQFFALSENYPQLRASENMKMLQEELSSTENKVAFARQAYNDQAMGYNTAQQQYPAALLAVPFGHHPVEFFEVEGAEAKKALKVAF